MAHAIISSRRYLQQPRLTRPQLRMAREDLGWQSLWATSVTAAIALLQKMRADDPAFAHAKWASQCNPPQGTWVQQVSALQSRFHIPHICLPHAHHVLPKTHLKTFFTNYRKMVVNLAVLVGLKLPLRPQALPWGWITTCVTTKPHVCK